MTSPRRSLAALAAWFLLLALPAPAGAQEGNPDTAPVQLGSVALSPAFRLVNVGWDSNVLYQPESEHPQGDFTATFAPSVEAWMRRNRVRMNGRAELDFNYFHELSAIRSVDQDYRGRLELVFGRVTPYVGGTWINARHRRNYEIDVPVRRLDSAWVAGVDVALTGKTTVGAVAGRSRVEYADSGAFAEPDLASALDADTPARGLYAKYAVTPLTTISADFIRDEVHLLHSPERDSSGYRMLGSVEFRPLALVAGRVQLGVRTREFEVAEVPPFTGLVGSVELGYTLLSRTSLSVQIEHDLAQSYRADYLDYLQTGLSATVAHRLTADWDLTATAGRYNLAYEVGAAASNQAAPDERVITYGVDLGYRLGRARVAAGLTRQARVAASSESRVYERTQIASSVTYSF